MQRRIRACGWLAAFSLLLAPPVARVAGAVELPPLDWRLAEPTRHVRVVAALAVEPQTLRVAIGDSQGALLGESGGEFMRVLHRGPVLDLVFLPGGSLLAATLRGLYRVDGVADAARFAPAPGSAGRTVRRMAAIPGITAAATDAGLFVAPDASRWQRLAGALPRQPATAVTLSGHGDTFACHAVVGGDLWRVVLRAGPNGFAAESAVREIIPFSSGGGAAVDLVRDLPGAALAVVFPRSLALRRLDVPGESWEVVRPELPPGARALRLGHAAGRYWLASDRGLLEAASLSGPWRRAAPPVGSAGVAAAAGAATFLYVATRDNLRVGRAPEPSAPGAPPLGTFAGAPIPADPPIDAVHRAALHYLGLAPARMEALWRGASQRGWWPIVSVRGVGEWGDDRGIDHDESFISGDTRYLRDRARGRNRDYEASLTLSWDFGDTVYQPESIDVSRETRAVIELRDDVLDEITQLYYERRRVLGELTLHAALPGPEQHRLRLRADELAAGIDAWTGGWFARQVSALVP